MATTESTPDIGFRSERGPILIALMLSSSLVALDATIIATAVLTIVGDLGGFAQFPWLFSIYLLAQAVSVPLYGKLSDLFGRKKIMVFGIAVFCLGSILCGLAWSMPALIAFRAIQGLGAGAVQPMSITIAKDLSTYTAGSIAAQCLKSFRENGHNLVTVGRVGMARAELVSV
ncbi:MFS family permease [Rhodococcus fascians]|nr:MFS family permease [Rhodococcus fascians]